VNTPNVPAGVGDGDGDGDGNGNGDGEGAEGVNGWSNPLDTYGKLNTFHEHKVIQQHNRHAIYR
jgi:hypothetical protein